MNILVVAAHPDDETVGCGGTVAKLAASGAEVAVVVLTCCAVADRYDLPLEEATARRRAECELATRRLGVASLLFEEFDEIHLAVTPQPAVAQAVEAAIRRAQPALILTHSAHDLNQDHRAAHEATMIAARPYDWRFLRRVLCYSSDPMRRIGGAANVFVDVSQHLATKLDAALAYKSEMRPAPDPRSIEFLERQARLAGAMIRAEAAEVFELAWEVA